jgi:hypothetical protein
LGARREFLPIMSVEAPHQSFTVWKSAYRKEVITAQKWTHRRSSSHHSMHHHLALRGYHCQCTSFMVAIPQQQNVVGRLRHHHTYTLRLFLLPRLVYSSSPRSEYVLGLVLVDHLFMRTHFFFLLRQRSSPYRRLHVSGLVFFQVSLLHGKPRALKPCRV